VQNPVFVTESGSLQELIHEATDNSGVQGAAFAMGVHVLFQILFTVFEYKYEFRFRVDDVVEAYDVESYAVPFGAQYCTVYYK